MIALTDIDPAPWNRYNWTGEFVSVDGCDASDFTESDVAEVIAWATTDGDGWDGETAGVVRLNDGRYVAWEAFWGPTGNGFARDAYGGTSDLVFAATAAAAIARLSERGRESLGSVTP